MFTFNKCMHFKAKLRLQASMYVVGFGFFLLHKIVTIIKKKKKDFIMYELNIKSVYILTILAKIQ